MGRRGRNSAATAERPAAASAKASPRLKQSEQGSTAAPAAPRTWRWLLWSALGVPLAGLTFLIAIAPPSPKREPVSTESDAELLAPMVSDSFRYLPDKEVYALDFDPRKVQFDLFEGWDREQDAYADRGSLAFVSGPMYERHYSDDGREETVPLGDIKLGNRVWRARNRSASLQRAFIGINHLGKVDFGYGELTPERARQYETFIGGLHELYNDLATAPSGYKGAYSVSMGQRIRYYLPRIRMVMGLRDDGRLEVFMSRDGLTLEQTKAMARSRGLVAAYMPDHASKSRFIIPGVKGFTEEDANWISGGATSFVHVPYMLKLERRPYNLQGNLLANLTPLDAQSGCSNPIACGMSFSGQMADRALAGFNRLMEQGVVPLARLIWSPSKTPSPTRPSSGAPFREPPITADPTELQQAPIAPAIPKDLNDLETPVMPAPLPPDLPSPETFSEAPELPELEAYDPYGFPIIEPDLDLNAPELPVLPPALPPQANNWAEPSSLPILR